MRSSFLINNYFSLVRNCYNDFDWQHCKGNKVKWHPDNILKVDLTEKWEEQEKKENEVKASMEMAVISQEEEQRKLKAMLEEQEQQFVRQVAKPILFV